jgi:hypothetical protein
LVASAPTNSRWSTQATHISSSPVYLPARSSCLCQDCFVGPTSITQTDRQTIKDGAR